MKEVKSLLLLQNKMIDELKSQIKISEYIPLWIRNLMDKGLIDSDGKTVITDNLESVAFAIREQKIVVTNTMLKRFINGKTEKAYSSSSIRKAVEMVNS